MRDVVEPGPRGHVGPALMTTRELGSGTRKSQDERTRGRVIPLVVCDDAVVDLTLGLIPLVVIVVFVVAMF